MGGEHNNVGTPQRAAHGSQHLKPGTAQRHDHDGASSKRDLTSWWKNFKRGSQRRDDEKGDHAQPRASSEAEPQGIFGVPLQTSVRYANVAISLYDSEGKSYIYGYVPIVVAKCGVFLKEKATDVEGIFRLSGSEKRIKELKAQFNSPDRYGKGLDWTGYTVHDAANIFRRYLNKLPEPIIPLQFYDRFREPLKDYHPHVVGPTDQPAPQNGEFDADAVIKNYQQLITELPPLNRQLLLYLLDLLAVFASKSDLNKMPTPNLSAIFQPGILSHPAHDMSPGEYRLSQDVLIFLIENQDHFLIGMQGTAADSKTVQEVESGPPTPQVRTPGSRGSKGMGRSGSTGSKYSGIVRRSVSVSSRQSKGSAGPIPVSPLHGPPSTSTNGSGGGGVHRSNTVPSKKSPAIGTGFFQREQPSDPPTPRLPKEYALAPSGLPQDTDSQYLAAQTAQKAQNLPAPPNVISPSSSEGTTPLASPADVRVNRSVGGAMAELIEDDKTRPEPITVPSQDGNISIPAGQETPGSAKIASLSNFFAGKPPPGDMRKPNKLQKRRTASSANPSAHSSQSSVLAADAEGSHASVPISTASIAPLLNEQTSARELLHPGEQGGAPSQFTSAAVPSAGRSSMGSFHTQSTTTDPGQVLPPTEVPILFSPIPEQSREVNDQMAGDATAEKERKRRWFSRKDNKDAEQDKALSPTDMAPPNPPFANHDAARRSRSSVASEKETTSRKSVNLNRIGSNVAEQDSSPGRAASHPIQLNDPGTTTTVSSGQEREGRDREKNPIHWLKGKLGGRSDKKEERDRQKEDRARSPPAKGDVDHRRGLSPSVQSLGAQLGGDAGRNGKSAAEVGTRDSREALRSMEVARDPVAQPQQQLQQQPIQQQPIQQQSMQPHPQIIQEQPQPEPPASVQAAAELRRDDAQVAARAAMAGTGTTTRTS